MQKSADAFRTISEVADDLSLPQHVLRFWETRFPQVRPLKRAGGRRYYRPNDVQLLKTIRQLLYDDGYTIKGVQRLLKEQGAKGLAAPARAGDAAGTLSEEALGALSDDADVAASPGLPEGGNPAGVTTLTDEDRKDLETALATVEECERILGALRAGGGKP